MAAAATYGCFDLAGLIASSLQKEAVLSTVEAQLLLYMRNITKQSQKHGNGKKPAANYKQAKVRNCACVAVLCVL